MKSSWKNPDPMNEIIHDASILFFGEDEIVFSAHGFDGPQIAPRSHLMCWGPSLNESRDNLCDLQLLPGWNQHGDIVLWLSSLFKRLKLKDDVISRLLREMGKERSDMVVAIKSLCKLRTLYCDTDQFHSWDSLVSRVIAEMECLRDGTHAEVRSLNRQVDLLVLEKMQLITLLEQKQNNTAKGPARFCVRPSVHVTVEDVEVYEDEGEAEEQKSRAQAMVESIKLIETKLAEVLIEIGATDEVREDPVNAAIEILRAYGGTGPWPGKPCPVSEDEGEGR